MSNEETVEGGPIVLEGEISRLEVPLVPVSLSEPSCGKEWTFWRFVNTPELTDRDLLEILSELEFPRWNIPDLDEQVRATAFQNVRRVHALARGIVSDLLEERVWEPYLHLLNQYLRQMPQILAPQDRQTQGTERRTLPLLLGGGETIAVSYSTDNLAERVTTPAGTKVTCQEGELTIETVPAMVIWTVLKLKRLLLERSPVRRCQNPRCQGFFQPHRTDQRYCSTVCGRRWRAHLRKERRKQERKRRGATSRKRKKGS